ASPQGWIEDWVLHPASLQDFLAAHPSTVQDRRFAVGYFLKPLGLAALGLFWIATGILGLGAARSEAAQALVARGLSESVASAAVAGGSLVDIVLGGAVLVARTARPALIGMLVVSLIYLAAATVLMPGLWLDPFGALLKVIPAMIAALAMLALMPDR
ncbi:DoxX-like family protein, partial [Hypericibacter sp.]|uniref:DoxX-like family protein n=1 Tax=Hypericibacter sp. TaxID=2705401 RepID=UPI003D6D86FD